MFEQLTQKKKLDKAKVLWKDAVSSDMKWQRDARQAFMFRDGEQWSSEEKQVLAEEMRPCLTFNLTKVNIDLIMGMNEDNRKVFRCTPVEPTDDFLCQVINDLSDWVYEYYDFILEEDAAFESALISGRGFAAIDFVPNPKQFGDIHIHLFSVPVHEVHFDPAARKADLSDASYMVWDKWVSKEDFKVRYPKYTGEKLEELVKQGRTADYGVGYSSAPSNIWDDLYEQEADDSDYEMPLDLEFYDRARNMIRIVHMEYWETYKRYFGFNPELGTWEEFDGKQLKNIKAQYEQAYGQEFVYETLMDKRVKWLQFVGEDILFDDVSPMPFDGFSVVPIVAYKDASGRTPFHFGIVKGLIDPQREVNKRWSQLLNLLNQQVQPGLFAETDAFVDQNQAEASIKSAGSITWVNPGTIQKGKFQERGMPQFPAAVMQIEQYSQEIMKRISGINPDLLGQDRGRQEPGVVIRLRQQQGTILLKPLFKNFNTFKKQVYQRAISIIMQNMPFQQMARILGQTEKYEFDPQQGIIIDKETQLIANVKDLENLQYNITPEESSGNMSKRMLELSAMLEMQNTGFPVPPESIINKMDISAEEKERWKAYIQQMQEQEQQMHEQAMQAELQKSEAELQIDAEKNEISREGNILDFLLGAMKISNQDAQLEHKEKSNVLDFVANNQDRLTKLITEMAKVDAQRKAAEVAKTQGGKTNERTDTKKR